MSIASEVPTAVPYGGHSQAVVWVSTLLITMTTALFLLDVKFFSFFDS